MTQQSQQSQTPLLLSVSRNNSTSSSSSDSSIPSTTTTTTTMNAKGQQRRAMMIWIVLGTALVVIHMIDKFETFLIVVGDGPTTTTKSSSSAHHVAVVAKPPQNLPQLANASQLTELDAQWGQCTITDTTQEGDSSTILSDHRRQLQRRRRLNDDNNNNNDSTTDTTADTSTTASATEVVPPLSPPKPFWVSVYPGSDKDNVVNALVNALLPQRQGAAKGLYDTCIGDNYTPVADAVTCATTYPMLNYFGGANLSPYDYGMSGNVDNNKFQSNVIILLRNPMTAIAEYSNMKASKYSRGKPGAGLTTVNDWRSYRDAWLAPNSILEWVSGLVAFQSMSTIGKLYVSYEELLDPIQGPIATQKLAQLLYKGGFTDVLGGSGSTSSNDDDNDGGVDDNIKCIWYQTVKDRIHAVNPRLEFAGTHNYSVGYTLQQKQSLTAILRNLQHAYVNDTALVPILQGYIYDIYTSPNDIPEPSRRVISPAVEDDATSNDTTSVNSTTDFVIVSTTKDNKSSPKSDDAAAFAPPVLQLRWDWTRLERHSALAQYITTYQNNCSLPIAYFVFHHSGLGSNLHIYSQALCNAMELGMYRIRPLRPWLWLDIEQCAAAEQNSTLQLPNADAWPSAMSCYFPEAEGTSCPAESSQPPIIVTRESTLQRKSCRNIQNAFGGIPGIRSGTTEFLFTRVSPLVQQEAQRQLNLVFAGAAAIDPTNLITVHMRWGDKSAEMKLAKVEEYINAINSLLSEEEKATTESNVVNIFLATEDPQALTEFRAAAPSHWTIYVDHYYTEMTPHRVTGYNGEMEMTKQLLGRPGLVAMGSVLVSMQANRYVLTTGSNWSRILNELRMTVVDPRCNGCTRLVDLQSGEW